MQVFRSHGGALDLIKTLHARHQFFGVGLSLVILGNPFGLEFHVFGKPVWVFSDRANVLVAAVAAIWIAVAEEVPDR